MSGLGLQEVLAACTLGRQDSAWVVPCYIRRGNNILRWPIRIDYHTSVIKRSCKTVLVVRMSLCPRRNTFIYTMFCAQGRLPCWVSRRSLSSELLESPVRSDDPSLDGLQMNSSYSVLWESGILAHCGPKSPNRHAIDPALWSAGCQDLVLGKAPVPPFPKHAIPHAMSSQLPAPSSPLPAPRSQLQLQLPALSCSLPASPSNETCHHRRSTFTIVTMPITTMGRVVAMLMIAGLDMPPNLMGLQARPTDTAS